MLTDSMCKSLNYSLQGQDLTDDLRLLEIRGYDMILGLDWLTKGGPMNVDWGNRSVSFERGGKENSITSQGPANSKIALTLYG